MTWNDRIWLFVYIQLDLLYLLNHSELLQLRQCPLFSCLLESSRTQKFKVKTAFQAPTSQTGAFISHKSPRDLTKSIYEHFPSFLVKFSLLPTWLSKIQWHFHSELSRYSRNFPSLQSKHCSGSFSSVLLPILEAPVVPSCLLRKVLRNRLTFFENFLQFSNLNYRGVSKDFMDRWLFWGLAGGFELPQLRLSSFVCVSVPMCFLSIPSDLQAKETNQIRYDCWNKQNLCQFYRLLCNGCSCCCHCACECLEPHLILPLF